jgi:hypothetical protein
MPGMYQEQSLGSILRSLRETYAREIAFPDPSRVLEMTWVETPSGTSEVPDHSANKGPATEARECA